LLKLLKIQTKIKKLRERKFNKFGMDVEKLFDIMVKRATYDIKDIYEVKQITLKDLKNEDYTIDHVQLKKWESIDGTLIEGIKQTKDSIQIKLPDRDKSIEMIGKYFGIFKETMKENETINLNEFANVIMKNYEKKSEPESK